MPAIVHRSRGLTALAMIVSLSVTACRVGTDLPSEEQDTLEPAEALGIATSLVRATVQNTVFSPAQALFYHSHGPAGRHSHPIVGPFVHDLGVEYGPFPSSHNLFNTDFSFDLSCESGGTLLLEAAGVGEGNPLIQRGFIDYQWGHDHEDCGIVLADGQRFVLDAPPYITGEAHVTYDGVDSAEISGVLTGGIAWEAETKSGECEVELTFSGSAATVREIVEVLLIGTFCDLDINATVALE